MGIVGAILAIAIAYWFYRTAEKHGIEPTWWGLIGVACYYFSTLMWSTGVVRPVLTMVRETDPGNLRVWVAIGLFSTALFGALIAVLVRRYVLLRMKPNV